MKIKKDKTTHRWISPLMDNVSSLRIYDTTRIDTIEVLRHAIDRSRGE